MELSANEILTIMFALLFIFGLTGLFLRLITNKTIPRKDYTQQNINFESNFAEKMNIVDLAYLLKNELMPEDIAALVFLWAENGHLEIKSSEINKGNIEISIAKLKNLPDKASNFEKLIFTEIFQNKTEKKITPLKFDNPKLNEKAMKLQENTKWIKLDIHNFELNTRFSKLFENIKNQQKNNFENSPLATRKEFTFLEFFLSTSSLFMLGAASMIFLDTSKNKFEAVIMGALGLLCAGFFFGAVYFSGKKWNFRNLAAAGGIIFCIYLTSLAYHTNYIETKNIFFENSYRYAGFIFGSILAFFIPKAKAVTPFGKEIKQGLKLQKKYICDNLIDGKNFFKLLPQLIVFNCVEKAGKKININKPCWYSGKENSNIFNFNLFVQDINSLRSAFKNLALKKQK